MLFRSVLFNGHIVWDFSRYLSVTDFWFNSTVTWEQSQHDFYSFKFIKVCFMTQNVLLLGECSSDLEMKPFTLQNPQLLHSGFIATFFGSDRVEYAYPILPGIGTHPIFWSISCGKIRNIVTCNLLCGILLYLRVVLIYNATSSM